MYFNLGSKGTKHGVCEFTAVYTQTPPIRILQNIEEWVFLHRSSLLIGKN